MLLTLRLMSPLSHGAFDAGDIGNASPIRRMPVVSLPGQPEIPTLSGNAIRGHVRRLVMRDLLDRAGLSSATMPAPQWQRLYAAIANGGHLEGSETTTDPAKIKALRAALPPLSLFGSALYTWMLSGRMSVGIAWPVCRETVQAGLVTALDGVPFAEELVHETSHTRHIEREEHDPAVSGVTPMPTTMEVLGTGALLVSDVRFDRSSTALERSVFAYGLAMLSDLGGKGGAGFGRVEVSASDDAPTPHAYTAWLEAGLADGSIAAALRELAEDITRKPKAKKGKGGPDAG
jgi:hypothetical protein